MDLKTTGKQLKKNFARNKNKVIITLIFLALAIGFILPLTLKQLAFARLQIKDVREIVYVKYEGDAFNSKAEVKKILNDKEAIQGIMKKLDNGTIMIISPQKVTKEAVFFNMDNDKSVSAFLDGNSLGFNYGSLWIEIIGLDKELDQMKAFEQIKVRELPNQ
ncbi:MAG: hypothetical protein HGA49_02605 [Eubacteriaceae bacterium]|nr:hypothetical protein [Eubacteriaceae bacterium]